MSQLTQTAQISVVLFSMALAYGVCYKFFKINNTLSMLLASLVGGFASGYGLPELCHHFAEGSFTFFNIVLIIYTATVFIYVQKASGGLDAMVRDVIVHFHGRPKLLVILLMFLIMLPPAFTGPGADGIFAFGALVSSVLGYMGVPLVNVTAFIALGGTLGVFAPPVNIPAMIISSGINMPYVGFFAPLAILTIPLAVFSALFLCMKHISGPLHAEGILKTLPPIPAKMKGIRIYLPLIVAIGLMLGARAFPHFFPHLGIPLVFVISTGVALLAGGKLNFMRVSMKAFDDTFTINGILLAVGVLIQIMALNGVRGLFVITAITAPAVLLYLAIFVGFPLFAGVLTSFGSASVFGIPLMLALLGRDPIIATVGLSLIATVGNLMPPTAVLGKPAAIVAEYKEPYMNVIRVSIIPLLVILTAGVLLILFADALRILRV